MIFRRVNEWPTWNWRGQWDDVERLRRQMELLSEGLSGRLLYGNFGRCLSPDEYDGRQ